VVIINEYPCFSDFTEESKPFEGDKKKINEILNHEIEKYRDNLPFYAVITKIDKYYAFTWGNNGV